MVETGPRIAKLPLTIVQVTATAPDRQEITLPCTASVVSWLDTQPRSCRARCKTARCSSSLSKRSRVQLLPARYGSASLLGISIMAIARPPPTPRNRRQSGRQVKQSAAENGRPDALLHGRCLTVAGQKKRRREAGSTLPGTDNQLGLGGGGLGVPQLIILSDASCPSLRFLVRS